VAGYHGPAGGPCTLCAANSYCPGGLVPETACHPNSYSAPGSDSVDDCLCNNGFQDSDDNDSCEACNSTACPNGIYRTDCTVNVASPDLDSVCSLPCVAPSANPSAYTWTSDGSYITPDYAGVADCSFECSLTYFRVSTSGNISQDTHLDDCYACDSVKVCAYYEYLDYAGCVPGGYVDSQCVNCTNKPANSHYIQRGTNDGNDCGWECDLGFYSNTTQCLPCSTGVCPYGDYRDQCDQGTNLAAGTDSECNLRCTTANPDSGVGSGAVQTSFTWTGLASYDATNFRGNNDCTLTCNFQGAEGYYFSNSPEPDPHLQTCTKITERNGTCGVGHYTLEATTTTDTSCVACTNYPINGETGLAFNETNRYSGTINVTVYTSFRWYTTGSTNDPYGHLGSTCEFECYEGPNSIAGYFYDAKAGDTIGPHSGFPVTGTCSLCNITFSAGGTNESLCEVGQYLGVCQATVSCILARDCTHLHVVDMAPPTLDQIDTVGIETLTAINQLRARAEHGGKGEFSPKRIRILNDMWREMSACRVVFPSRMHHLYPREKRTKGGSFQNPAVRDYLVTPTSSISAPGSFRSGNVRGLFEPRGEQLGAGGVALPVSWPGHVRVRVRRELLPHQHDVHGVRDRPRSVGSGVRDRTVPGQVGVADTQIPKLQ
jgi:hypothetical protein